jgi:signal transduction histidine kinase/tetratricopeptide (TPR) repeat protein
MRAALLLLFLFFGLNQSLFAQQDSLAEQMQRAKENLYKQPQLAKAQLEELLVNARSKGNLNIQFEASKQLSFINSNSGNFDAAKAYLIDATAIADANNRADQKAELSYLLGTLFHAQGDLSQALQKYLEALRYYEQVNHLYGKLNTYLMLADLYSRQNNFSRAIDYNLKALTLFQQKNDKFRQLNIYEQVGSMYERQNMLNKAIEYYTQALKVYREIDNHTGEAAALINLARIQLAQGKTTLAITSYEQANKLATPLQILPLEVRSLIGMAKANTLIKEYEAANLQYRKAIVLAKKAGMKIELEEAYEGLSEVYKGLKDPGTSKAFRSLSAEIKDSLYNDSILKRTSDLQLLYETEKKQAQIELMAKEEKLQKLDLNQTKQVKNFFIALSVLLVLLIFVFVFFIRQNSSINKQLKKGMAELEVKNVEIEKQSEQLKQLNQVKDRFFSIISHDLRNNLTTMKLYFDLVANADFKGESQQSLGKQVAGSVQNTIDLLENLLVWASGQIKGVQAEPKKVNIHHLAQENCQMLMSMAIQKNIELQNDTDEDACIMADPNMVNLILRNLLSNALKFTPEGGSVSILSQEEDEFHQIIVIDNGVGIDAEKIPHLFTAHLNVSTQGTGNEKGTGLGLMLCKEFVEKNGGSIWVESEAGKGSSFYFTFPKVAVSC